MVVKETRPYYLVIRPWKGGYAVNSFMRPTDKTKSFIKRLITEHQAHVVQTTDVRFVDSATLSGGKISVHKDQARQEALKKLYEGSNLDSKFL